MAKNQSNSLISVILPVYNTDKYLAESIQSVINQTYRNFELIVIDDGSTDRSAAIAAEFARQDSRIRLLTIEHAGRSQARNAGIIAARGSIIAWQDADDISLPERFAAQLEWLNTRDVKICGSSVKRFGNEDGLLWFPETNQAIQSELCFRIGLLQPTVMMHSDVARENLYLDQASFEDYEMWTRLAAQYQLSNLPQILLLHRCHTRQSHVVEAAGFEADQLAYSQRHFKRLFPQASSEDCQAMVNLTTHRPVESLSRLNLIGEWLIRLADTPDNFLRHYMVSRWKGVCLRSTHLGPQVYKLYTLLAPRFISPRLPNSAALQIMCLLRLHKDSRLYNLMAKARRMISTAF